MSERLQGLGGPADDGNEEFEEILFRPFNGPMDDRVSDGLEHIEFYTALNELQQREPAIYASVTSALTAEQARSLTVILQQGGQLISTRQSKAVSAQGGFNFAACSVPTSFNFAKK